MIKVVEIVNRKPALKEAYPQGIQELAAFNARIGIAVADVLPRFSLSGEFAGSHNGKV